MKGKLGGARPGAGRPSLKPGLRRVTNQTVEIQVVDTAARTVIADTLKGLTSAPLPLWFRTIMALPAIEQIEIQKKLFGKFVKVSALAPGDVDPNNIEATLLGQKPFGPAEYNFKVIHEGDYVGNGRTFIVGGEEAIARSEVTARGLDTTLEDGEAAVSRALKQRAGLLSIKQIDDLLDKDKGGEDDMKGEQLLQLAAALKPERQDISPLISILENNARAAEARAEKAEQRTHDLLMKQMDNATAGKTAELTSGASILTALGPVLEFVKPLLSPGLLRTVLGRFMSEPAPEGGWTPEGIKNSLVGLAPLLEPFMPVISSLVQSAMKSAPAPAAPPSAMQPALQTPQPENGGEPVENPLKPIYDALVARLQKPADDFDPKKLCAFCASVVVHPDGSTLFNLFESLSETDDDLAKVSLTQPMYDARFIDAQTWPGVVKLLNYIREQTAVDDEERRKAEHDSP